MKKLRKLRKNANVAANNIKAYACSTFCECDYSCYGGSKYGMQVNTISSSYREF